MLAAYFYPATKAAKRAGKPGAFELHRIESGERFIILTAPCADRCDARRQAHALHATPWNF